MKLVLVTGSAQRLGRTVIEAFAREGYACLVHANRSEAEARELCAGINAAGGRAAYFLHAITDPAVAADAILDAALAQFGMLPSCSVLSAASYGLDDPARALAQQVTDQLVLNYLFPAAYCAALAGRVQALAPAQAQEDRSVVLFTDYKVAKVNPDQFAYSLSKHALEGTLPYLAVAFARQIRVNAIAPGPILAAHGLTQADLDALVQSRCISGKSPRPQDIAATALFLANTPSLYGQHIFVDAAARFEKGAHEYGVVQ